MEEEKSVFNDAFAKYVGISALEFRPGYAAAKTIVNEEHLNGAKTAHGGILFTLADYAFALAANAGEDEALSVNASMNYTKFATLGEELIAEAILVSRSRRLGTYRVDIFNAKKEVIAAGQFIAYYKIKDG